MFRVDEYGDLSSLAALRSDWQELHRQTPNADFFQSFDWLETYWRHYGDAQRLRVLAVRKSNQLIGIVPLTILREPSRLGRLRILTYPQGYWGSFYGPVGPQPREALAAALKHVYRTSRSWDLLDLRFAPPRDMDAAHSFDEMAAAGFVADSRQTDSATIIDLPRSFDDYFNSRPKKWRVNYRRWLRRLDELGDVCFVRHRPGGVALGDDDPRWDLYDDCESVALRSWQHNSATGTTITHAAVRPFLREMHATACAAGTADISLLYLDGRPIAFLYAYAYQGRVFGLRCGYDESASRDGLGNILYLSMFEDSIARGDTTIDLGPGSLAAKAVLATRVVPIYRHTYGNPLTCRGLAWRAKRTAAKLRDWLRPEAPQPTAPDTLPPETLPPSVVPTPVAPPTLVPAGRDDAELIAST